MSELKESQFMEELCGAVARGWCYPETQMLEMDVRLASAISIEVAKFVVPIITDAFIALRLTNSMLLCGEHHTEQSIRIVVKALNYRKETPMGTNPANEDVLGKPEAAGEAVTPEPATPAGAMAEPEPAATETAEPTPEEATEEVDNKVVAEVEDEAVDPPEDTDAEEDEDEEEDDEE